MMKRIYLLPVVAFISCFAFACKKNKDTVTETVTPADTTTISNTKPNDSTNKTFLALGDSYTIGQSVGVGDRFPAQTIALLKSNGINMQDAEYIATSGWTTVNLLNAITVQNPVGPYDIVTLLIGVNDQYQSGDTTGYRDRFTELLKEAIQFAAAKPSHVFVVSIPDYSVTPFASGSNVAEISKEIDEFNAINKEVTMSLQAIYTDITPSTREALHDPELIAGDGLHPSAKEYAVWAKMLAPKMEAVLK